MNDVPIEIILDGDLEFTIEIMICTLKNIVGDYTFCKGRLVKIYSQLLNQVSNGNIIVRNHLWPYGKIDIEFKNGWDKYNVSKDFEKGSEEK